MKYAIIYSSKTGNTKLLADNIYETLNKDECIYFGEPDTKALDADRIYVGFWTDKGSCNEETAAFLKSVSNKELFLFGTAGFGEDQDYFDTVLKKTSKNISKDNKVIGSFMCQGKMPYSVRERYEKMKQSKIKIPNIDTLIKNFDKALSHPDSNDIENLCNEIKLHNM